MTTAAQPLALVVGEAMVDVLSDGVGEPIRVPGGSPANVALGLARMDIPTTLLTHLADDADGRLALDHLIASDVIVHPASFSADRTSVAVATPTPDGSANYTFDVSWELADVTGVPIPDLLHVGSYSAFARPGSEQVAALVRRATEQGAIVSVDPNIRPALIGEREGVRARFAWLLKHADVVKLSSEDLAWLYPGGQTDDALAALQEWGAPTVFLTQGGDGVLVATGEGIEQVQALSTSVADTVGAGDSFMAALLAQVITEGLDLSDPDVARAAAHQAAEAAAITVSRRGADLPRRAELTA